MRLGPTLHDVRFGLRLWRRNPAFFGLMLLVLVLGVGTTTAMFSLLQALLWRPLPYPEPEQLLELSARRATGTGSPISVRDFLDWRTRSQTLSRVSIAHNWLFSLASEGQPPEGVVGAKVSGEFFLMLGLEPLLGRLLGPEDDRVGAPPAAVLSAEVWQRRFGSDPAVIGRSIRLDGQPHTVIGIAPAGFGFSYPGSERSFVWTPIAVSPSFAWFASSHSIREWHGLGRRTANASLSEVEAELSQISATADADGQSERIAVSARDLHAAIMGESDSSLWVRLAAVGMVFLVVCSNVSNLLFVRAEARRAELTMRAAFGATRLRLVRQLLTETLLCFLVAAPLSALSARWLVDLLRALSFEQYSELQQLELPVDARAWAFCFGACVIAGLLSGLLPALVVSRVDLLTVLKQSGAGASMGKAAAGLRGLLVVAQVALAFALLSGSALSLLRMNELLATPVGFDAAGLIDLRLLGTHDLVGGARAETRRLAEAMLARIAAEPGVESVAANEFTPLTGAYAGTVLEVEGRVPLPSDPRLLANRNPVTPGYFETMRIPLLRGRGFSGTDDGAAAPVAIVSQSLAQRFFPGLDPIGRRIRQPDVDGPAFREIVGVVADVRRDGLRAALEPETYVPFAQASPGSVVFVIRAGHAGKLIRELPRVVAAVDPSIGAWTGSMEGRVRRSVGDSERVSIVLGAFAALALALATLGLYGMISYATLRETRGLGIRAALGSPPGALLWVVLRDALSWLGLGSALGVVAAWLIGRVLAHQILGTRSFDLRVCLVVAVTLVAAGTLAAWVPARRALRVPPGAALRCD